VEPTDKLPIAATASNSKIQCEQPIRTRKPEEIEQREYNKFYESTATDKNGPMTKTHSIAEGEVTFKPILFVHDSQPSDLFNKYGQATENIKLYVRRVFIT
jgi:heat shock protein beta